MKVISICSQKGGVSKSTTTIEIGTEFKKRGYSVLVIDFDQQCSLSKNVAADFSKPSIYDVLHADASYEDAIQHLDFFDLIPASEKLSRADREFIGQDDGFILADFVDMIRNDYDFIFVDNAPSRNILLTMTYIASDYIIIPTECDESSLDSLVTTQRDINIIRNGRHHDSHAKIIAYVLAKNENTIMHKVALDNLKEIAAENPDKPFVATIRKSIKASEIKTFHSAIVKDAPGSPLARDYINIADKIEEKIMED